MLERFDQELERRSRVIRIFPNEVSCLRLSGTMCLEQSEEWETDGVYLTFTKASIQRIKSGMDMASRFQPGFRYASARLIIKHDFTQKFGSDYFSGK